LVHEKQQPRAQNTQKGEQGQGVTGEHLRKLPGCILSQSNRQEERKKLLSNVADNEEVEFAFDVNKDDSELIVKELKEKTTKSATKMSAT
jgi:hypothetical protein